MFDDDGSNFHTIGCCLISRGCKISSFLTSSTLLFHSVCFGSIVSFIKSRTHEVFNILTVRRSLNRTSWYRYLMNSQFMFVWENLRNIISSPHKTCLCVFVSFLCVSMSVSRPEGLRVFLSLSVCFLWSVYVVAKIIVVGFEIQRRRKLLINSGT